MNLKERIEILSRLKTYLQQNSDELQQVKHEANYRNSWFTLPFINIALENICTEFLDEKKIENWVSNYTIKEDNNSKILGIVMAGNIPAVGFHDFLCGFICGYKLMIKLSSKDDVLLKHFYKKLCEFNSEVATQIRFADTLKDCDVYIATGSNNSSRYFEYYFSKYPHIIRRNRTSVAILDGAETVDELKLLAKDIQLFFGQGCRNITHLFIPENYNFEPLINALKEYEYFLDLHKYKHNYDYQLAMLMMSNKKYITDGSVILSENESLFSAISCVHYSYYQNKSLVIEHLENNDDVQCIVGKEFVAFGQAQEPTLFNYADGVDTMQFLTNL